MNIKRLANRTERKAAKKLGARRTPASGSKFGADLILGEWNIELKHPLVHREAYTIRVSELRKGMTRAYQHEGRRFAMRVELLGLTVWVIPDCEMVERDSGLAIYERAK